MRTRRTTLACIVLVMLVFATVTGTALAKGPGSGGKNGARNPIGGASGPANGFIDLDGDGINDHFVDADGDGICDGCSEGICGTGLQTQKRTRLCTCTPAMTGTRDRTRLRTCTPEPKGIQDHDRIHLRACTPAPKATVGLD